MSVKIITTGNCAEDQERRDFMIDLHAAWRHNTGLRFGQMLTLILGSHPERLYDIQDKTLQKLIRVVKENGI